MHIRKTMFAVAAVAMLASSALANSVDVSYEGYDAGRNVRIHLAGRDGGMNVFAGQLIHAFSNGTGNAEALDGTMKTYCTELVQYVNGDTNGFEVIDVADAPGSSPMGETKAQALRELYAYADGDQFSDSDSSSNRSFAAAFQIAVWEIVYDYDGSQASLDEESGDLTVTRTSGYRLYSSVRGYLNDMYAAIGSGAEYANLFAVTNDCFQDQLVVMDLPVIPLPGAMGMGAFGLAAVIWRRRR